MRLTRQPQIQGVQPPDLAAAMWPLLVQEIWQEFFFLFGFRLTCNDEFHSHNAKAPWNVHAWLRGLQRRLCDIRSQQLSVRLQLLLRDLKQNLIKVLALIEQALRRAQGPTLCLSCIIVTCQSQRLAANFLKNEYTQDIWQHLPLLWRYLQNH